MTTSPRLAAAILLLGLGMALAFAAGFSYGDAVFEVEAPLIRAGDGHSISLLTGSYVPR